MSHLDINTIVLVFVALLNAYVAWISKRTDKNMGLLEKATNSMKDALVASTAKASLAEGTAAGLAAGRAENTPATKD